MDLNYLFLRQQVEKSLAEAAQGRATREAHEELARRYELEIERKSGGRIIFPSSRKNTGDEEEIMLRAMASQAASS
jgi:hypothetical protein